MWLLGWTSYLKYRSIITKSNSVNTGCWLQTQGRKAVPSSDYRPDEITVSLRNHLYECSETSPCFPLLDGKAENSLLWKKLILCSCRCMGTSVLLPWVKEQLGGVNWCFQSIMWVPGIELRSSELGGKGLTQWAISAAQPSSTHWVVVVQIL